MRNRWFWLANLLLLLVYLWTLTEESAVQVRVEGAMCTAVFAERYDLTRASTIPCSDIQGGFVGLYFSNPTSETSQADWGPLDWLLPRSGWRTVTFTELREGGRRLRIEVGEELPGWEHVWGEWRPLADTAVMQWQTPIYGDYLVTTELRRPEEKAGILLLQADGEHGWAFITDPTGRRGVWWQWQDGQLSDPIVGIPFQKSALAQMQSLLRRILRAHQGALLLLLAVWLMVQLVRSISHKSVNFTRLQPSLSRWRLSARHDKWVILLIAILVLSTTVTIANNVLERMPHVQDSITYLFQAQLIARGKIWADAPSLPSFFEHEFLTVRNGRWFGQYPPGFPALLALGVLLGQPWLVNPILAMLTVLLLYQVGRVLFNHSTGVMAIILALISPFFLFMSGSLMAHPAEMFWVIAFMLSWTYTLQRETRRWPLLAGLALGMTLLTRQATAVATLLPFLIVMSLGVWTDVRQRKRFLVKLGWLLATAVPLLVCLLFYQNSLTGDPFREPRQVERPFDRIGFGIENGESPNAFRITQTETVQVVDWFIDPTQPPRGHSLARGIYNTEQNWRALEKALFGWPPILTLVFIWLAFLGQRPSRADYALLAMFVCTVLVYIFYWADGIMYGPRYYYGALPALLLLTARGMQGSAQRMGRGGATAVAFWVALLIAVNLFFNMPEAVDNYRGYNFVRGQERTQVEQAIDRPAVIFVANNPLNWWEYGRFFSGNTPWLDGQLIYARDLGDEANKRLLCQFPDYTPYQWRDNILKPFSVFPPVCQD